MRRLFLSRKAVIEIAREYYAPGADKEQVLKKNKISRATLVRRIKENGILESEYIPGPVVNQTQSHPTEEEQIIMKQAEQIKELEALLEKSKAVIQTLTDQIKGTAVTIHGNLVPLNIPSVITSGSTMYLKSAALELVRPFIDGGQYDPAMVPSDSEFAEVLAAFGQYGEYLTREQLQAVIDTRSTRIAAQKRYEEEQRDREQKRLEAETERFFKSFAVVCDGHVAVMPFDCSRFNPEVLKEISAGRLDYSIFSAVASEVLQHLASGLKSESLLDVEQLQQFLGTVEQNSRRRAEEFQKPMTVSVSPVTIDVIRAAQKTKAFLDTAWTRNQ